MKRTQWICDRCKKEFYTDDDNTAAKIIRHGFGCPDINVDMCQDCTNEFLKFVNMEPVIYGIKCE